MIFMRIIFAPTTGIKFKLLIRTRHQCQGQAQEALHIWTDSISSVVIKEKKALTLTIYFTSTSTKKFGNLFTRRMGTIILVRHSKRCPRLELTTLRSCMKAVCTYSEVMMAKLATTTCTNSNSETRSTPGLRSMLRALYL